MEEPFFNQERLARIAKAGADTGFEYDTEVVPSNCLPGATEYVPGTDPGAYCFYSDLIRDLQRELDDIQIRLSSDSDFESLRSDVLEMNRMMASMLSLILGARTSVDGDVL